VSSVLNANTMMSSRFCRGSQAKVVSTVPSRVLGVAAFYGERRMVRYVNSPPGFSGEIGCHLAGIS
jgi:hypothetical protein